MARRKVERYIPSIGNTNWNIKELPKEDRNKLRNKLVMGIVHTEEEYQTVIGYMYKKFPFEMDGIKTPENGEENVAIQWNYSPYKNKVRVYNKKDSDKDIFDMYAFVYYDSERNFEPVAFAGSYFKRGIVDISDITYENELIDLKEKLNLKNNLVETALGEGYVMFVDPNYRRLGLGNFSWTAEAQLYRDIANSNVNNLLDNSDIYPMILPLQVEIQNEYSVQSTLSCFKPTEDYPTTIDKDQLLFGDHSKHLYITSNGRVKNDGSRCQIRLIMNYDDKNLIKSFDNMPKNMKEIYNKPHWEFLEREAANNNTTVEEYKKELIKPWNK